MNPKRNFEIDICYPGEFIPSSQCEIFSSPQTNKINFNQKPIYISLKRGDNEISLKKNTVRNHQNIEQTSYILAIHSQSGVDYRMVETPDGMIIGQGNPLLLLAVQKDKDFGKYISFVLKDELESTLIDSHKWNLSKNMYQTREK